MSTKQRFFKRVGKGTYSRLPHGPIDHDTYQQLTPDLRHIVLHSGDWEPMSDDEIKKYKAELADAEKKAAVEAEKIDADAEKAAEAGEVSQ